MDTNTGESPGHQSQSQQLGNSPSEEEMGHWTPTGVEPKDYDDDDETPKDKWCYLLCLWPTIILPEKFRWKYLVKQVIHGYELLICLVLHDITDLYGFA